MFRCLDDDDDDTMIYWGGPYGSGSGTSGRPGRGMVLVLVVDLVIAMIYLKMDHHNYIYKYTKIIILHCSYIKQTLQELRMLSSRVFQKNTFFQKQIGGTHHASAIRLL